MLSRPKLEITFSDGDGEHYKEEEDSCRKCNETAARDEGYLCGFFQITEKAVSFTHVKNTLLINKYRILYYVFQKKSSLSLSVNVIAK